MFYVKGPFFLLCKGKNSFCVAKMAFSFVECVEIFQISMSYLRIRNMYFCWDFPYNIDIDILIIWPKYWKTRRKCRNIEIWVKLSGVSVQHLEQQGCARSRRFRLAGQINGNSHYRSEHLVPWLLDHKSQLSSQFIWSSLPWSWNLSWNDISLSSHALKIFTLIFKTKHCIIFFYPIPLCHQWSNIPIVFLNKSRLRFWFRTFEDNHLCLLQLPEIDVLTACLLKYSRRTSRVLNSKFHSWKSRQQRN